MEKIKHRSVCFSHKTLRRRQIRRAVITGILWGFLIATAILAVWTLFYF